MDLQMEVLHKMSGLSPFVPSTLEDDTRCARNTADKETVMGEFEFHVSSARSELSSAFALAVSNSTCVLDKSFSKWLMDRMDDAKNMSYASDTKLKSPAKASQL